MADLAMLRQRLLDCPAGRDGWREFEDVCTDVFVRLFVPPLSAPKPQPATRSGAERRDVVFPNWEKLPTTPWGKLFAELGARMLLFECKNYGSEEIGADEVRQTSSYMRKPWGRLAFMCCSKQPHASAHVLRNTLFSNDGKMILFLTRDHLVEMLAIKERGDDPAQLIMDLVDLFYLQHE